MGSLLPFRGEKVDGRGEGCTGFRRLECFVSFCFSSAGKRIMCNCIENDVLFVSTQECRKGSLLKMQLSVYTRKRKS